MTVRNCVYGIRSRLGVGSMQELALWAVRHGLLDDYAAGGQGYGSSLRRQDWRPGAPVGRHLYRRICRLADGNGGGAGGGRGVVDRGQGQRDTPYVFMAVNAHLYFGNYISDRRQEFNALVDWIISRLEANSRAYYPNFVLLGDLNLDYDNPGRDRARIEERIKSLNGELDGANVNFPFLDVHPGRQDIFRTNARMTETFDQIGLFNRDPRLPTHLDNAAMGSQVRGPDYGVFEFGNLFSEAVLGSPLQELPSNEKRDLIARFEHKVSDRMPLWLRLPLPID